MFLDEYTCGTFIYASPGIKPIDEVATPSGSPVLIHFSNCGVFVLLEGIGFLVKYRQFPFVVGSVAGSWGSSDSHLYYLVYIKL